MQHLPYASTNEVAYLQSCFGLIVHIGVGRLNQGYVARYSHV